MPLDARLFLLVLLAGVLAAAGCGRPPAGPGETAALFMERTLAGDARAAYGLLTDEDRRTRPLSDVEKAGRLLELSNALGARVSASLLEVRQTGDEAVAQMRVSAPAEQGGGHQEYLQVFLRKEGGRWRVWAGYACQERARPRLDEAERALAAGRKKAAEAEARAVVADCPQSRRAVAIVAASESR